jgi:hypothetical protein
VLGRVVEGARVEVNSSLGTCQTERSPPLCGLLVEASSLLPELCLLIRNMPPIARPGQGFGCGVKDVSDLKQGHMYLIPLLQ